ncbi:diadenylate cyclase [Geomonas sp. Red69]|uniref:Diadenylate cyclase n=1 Tax=Geomonas diazotrophica TaxID=2843197 RepID=A0ABX8JBX2_9BACT|nr:MULTISPECIES: diadenylate cyclase [Geomonas]MBU5638150.1 diadenylate cyclase [Geomonas diazotrophica]QWV95870.1 diadenylate cyclase [Geomonas nitrogeniifigens]QXE84956.1 diadenylate cyclase [Geomonas nitrogeniifigens]
MREGHSYPRELVAFIYARGRDEALLDRVCPGAEQGKLQLPERALLEQVISTCYQASLLREEERPVMFRLIIRDSYLFAAQEGPPTGMHRLVFSRTRPFNEYELHRLAPAADFYRTLIGIFIDPVLGAQIWGLLHSGTRWMHAVYGGRKTSPPMPPSLVVYVTGPGQISVCIGDEIIASLNGGQINCPTLDVFNSDWMTKSLASLNDETFALHRKARQRAERPWADLDPQFGSKIGQQAIRRIISVIRNSNHGGLLVYLPAEMAEEIMEQNQYLALKYQFLEFDSRQRFLSLTLRIMNTLAEINVDAAAEGRMVGWHEYVDSKNENIALLDEAIFDVAHFIAALSAVDGAVVITKRQELLGFGGVISGDLDSVGMVAHALDTEGEQCEPVLSEGVGTRHRAAYRLCQRLHQAIAIVISQDESVQIVRWHNGSVTYWDQVPTGVPGF